MIYQPSDIETLPFTDLWFEHAYCYTLSPEEWLGGELVGVLPDGRLLLQLPLHTPYLPWTTCPGAVVSQAITYDPVDYRRILS